MKTAEVRLDFTVFGSDITKRGDEKGDVLEGGELRRREERM